MAEPAPYVGRFAPSPSGPLHLGSLLAAVASYLQAKANNGRWLLRIEDIDPPREQAGADRIIIDALRAYGFEWDGPVIYQSHSLQRHEQLVSELLLNGNAYPCTCSRRDLANAKRSSLGTIYPGNCRNGSRSQGDFAIRVRTNNQPIQFCDRLQGNVVQRLETESGDFVIKRRDGLIAYHLAVVADDNEQGVTEVVRGIDLLDSTPRQIHLQNLLSFQTPHYLHIPVAENLDGQKLSKLTGATAVDTQHVGPSLVRVLQLLGQQPSRGLANASLGSIWHWAIEHWQVNALENQKSITIENATLAKPENGVT